MTTKQELENALEEFNSGLYPHTGGRFACQRFLTEGTVETIIHVLTQALREDVVMVPREPDQKMRLAGFALVDCSTMSFDSRKNNIQDVYKAMIGAFEKDGGK